MMSVTGISGAGIIRTRTSTSPDRSSTISTPRSVLSRAVSAHGDSDHLPEKEPASEGNLKIVNKISTRHEIMCCKYSEDASLLAVGMTNGSITVLSGETGAPVYNLADNETKMNHLPCTSINFRQHLDGDRADNLLLATYASGAVKLWHTSTGQCLHTIHETRQTLSAAFDISMTKFVTTGSDDKVYVYDASTKQKIQTCQPSPSRDVMDGHRSRVFSVKFHPRNSDQFITGGWDDTIQYWQVGQEHSIRKSYGPHICGDALDIDPQHNHILSGSWRKTENLQVWDYESGKLLKTVPQDNYNSLLYCAQWLGKEHIVTGGCDMNMVRILDRGTLQTTGRIVDLSRAVYCMDNTRLGKTPRFAIGSSSNVLFIEMRQS